MSTLKRVMREIHSRSVWQVLGAYVIGVWLLFETFEIEHEFAATYPELVESIVTACE